MEKERGYSVSSSISSIGPPPGLRTAARTIRQGMLAKRGRKAHSTWRRRYAVLTEEMLFYYKSKEDYLSAPEDPQGFVELRRINAVTKGENVSKTKRTDRVEEKIGYDEEGGRTKSEIPDIYFALHTKERVYQLAAPTPRDCAAWKRGVVSSMDGEGNDARGEDAESDCKAVDENVPHAQSKRVLAGAVRRGSGDSSSGGDGASSSRLGRHSERATPRKSGSGHCTEEEEDEGGRTTETHSATHHTGRTFPKRTSSTDANDDPSSLFGATPVSRPASKREIATNSASRDTQFANILSASIRKERNAARPMSLDKWKHQLRDYGSTSRTRFETDAKWSANETLLRPRSARSASSASSSASIPARDDGDGDIAKIARTATTTTTTANNVAKFSRLRCRLLLRWLDVVLSSSSSPSASIEEKDGVVGYVPKYSRTPSVPPKIVAEDADATPSIRDRLRDGTLLCRLMRVLAPVQAEAVGIPFRVHKRATRPRTAIANLERALRVLYKQGRVRMTAVPSSRAVYEARSNRPAVSLLQEIYATFVSRKMAGSGDHVKCLEWWNAHMRRHPLGGRGLWNPSDVDSASEIRERWTVALRRRRPLREVEETSLPSHDPRIVFERRLRDGTAMACVLHTYAGDAGNRSMGLAPMPNSSTLCTTVGLDEVRHFRHTVVENASGAPRVATIRRVTDVFDRLSRSGVILVWTPEEWVRSVHLHVDFGLLQLEFVRRRLMSIPQDPLSSLWGRRERSFRTGPVRLVERVPSLVTAARDGGEEGGRNQKMRSARTKSAERTPPRTPTRRIVESEEEEEEAPLSPPLRRARADSLVDSAMTWLCAEPREVCWALATFAGGDGEDVPPSSGHVEIVKGAYPIRLRLSKPNDEVVVDVVVETMGTLEFVSDKALRANVEFANVASGEEAGVLVGLLDLVFDTDEDANTFFGSLEIVREMMLHIEEKISGAQ